MIIDKCINDCKLKEVKEKLARERLNYAFLDEIDKTHKIIFLCLGGSYAYGTNVESSDVDIRGICLNTEDEILLDSDFEQFEDRPTDTVVYTIVKAINLLCNINPNTIEMLGNLDRNTIYKTEEFDKFIIPNLDLFLSKQALYTFGGYADAQLNRLNNKAGRTNGLIEYQNIVRSIDRARQHLSQRYNIKADTDLLIKSADMKIDVHVDGLSKEDMQGCLTEIVSILKDYNKLGKRNKNAIEHDKLTKHTMHLVRLYLMAIDIFKENKINTYREKDREFLLSIRNNVDNKWLDSDDCPTETLMNFVSEKDQELRLVYSQSNLPNRPDKERVNTLIKDVKKYCLR